MANVDYFTDWSHEAIDVWLACAFEHTGELDVRAADVVLTVSGDPLVIGALRARFDVGEVTERLERRPIADWRLTKPDELRAILWTIQPFATESLSHFPVTRTARSWYVPCSAGSQDVS